LEGGRFGGAKLCTQVLRWRRLLTLLDETLTGKLVGEGGIAEPESGEHTWLCVKP
jgi:hypothetical protein